MQGIENKGFIATSSCLRRVTLKGKRLWATIEVLTWPCTYPKIDLMAPRKERWNYERLGSNQCWNWLDRLDKGGYGMLKSTKHSNRAHRAMYELYVKPIKPDWQIDHLCRNRRCVNPKHLEQVTARVNWLRGNCPFKNFKISRYQCPKGHHWWYYNDEQGRVKKKCLECLKERREAKELYKTITFSFRGNLSNGNSKENLESTSG